MQMSAGYPFRHWSVASSRTVLANRVLKVRQDTCVIPASGGALEYFVLKLADWVNVVPVTSARELVMVRQYRHATRGVTLEIPAGSVKENEVPADALRTDRALHRRAPYNRAARRRRARPVLQWDGRQAPPADPGRTR
jgi:hypothetical protein